MLKKYILLLGLILVFSRGVECLAASPYAYSLEYHPKNRKVSLVKIDVGKNEIVARAKGHEMNNNVTIDRNGDVFISRHRDVHSLGQQVDKYITDNNKIIRASKTFGVGPMTVVPYKNRLFVLMYCRGDAYGKQRATSIEVLKSKGKHKYEFEKEIILGSDSYAYSDHLAVDVENKKIYVLVESCPVQKEKKEQAFIYEIDLNSAKVTNVKQLNEIGSPAGLAYANGGKLYVTATHLSNGNDRVLNRNIYVYSAKDFSLLRTIETQIVAKDLVYVKEVNKLYVLLAARKDASPSLWVIDCKKDKVIKKIPLNSWCKMNYVGQKKLYVSTYKVDEENRGILVIDVDKDEIIDKIVGNLVPVSLDLSDL